MGLIDTILQRPEFVKDPPVLVDIGASGGLNPAWSPVAKSSICIAFDGDQRELGRLQARKIYKELHVYNHAVIASHDPTADFYLTRVPACSSLLPPNTEKLAAWEFAGRFEVTEKKTIQTVHLQRILGERNLNRVDWFKSDSQGTDLRLFRSLGEDLSARVLVAEFEPGIMDAYFGEDKLWQLMAAMQEQNFWMSSIKIFGTQRIRKEVMDGFSNLERAYMVHLLKSSPGWAEVTYMNSFAARSFTQREYLLGWVFASIAKQHGFALELADQGVARFNDPIFEILRERSKTAIRFSYANLPAYFPLLWRLLRRWKKQRRHGVASGANLTQLADMDHL